MSELFWRVLKWPPMLIGAAIICVGGVFVTLANWLEDREHNAYCAAIDRAKGE